MKTPHRVLGVGSALVDVLARVDDDFLRLARGAKGGMEMVDSSFIDELVGRLDTSPAMMTGGATGNTIFGLARLGVPVAMFSKIGRDRAGAFYRDELAAQHGSVREFIETDAAATGRCLSLITPDSERTMRSCLGASQLVTPEEVEKIDFSAYTLVYLEGYMLFLDGVVPAVLRRARAAGCRIAMDLASFEVVRIFREPLTEMLRNSVDLAFANEDEAAALFGDGIPEREMAARLAQWCPVAALKLGRRGALIAAEGAITPVEALTVDAVDTTGAGDLWAAGFLAGYLDGRSPEACGRIAARVAAEVVQVVGGRIPDERWPEILQQL